MTDIIDRAKDWRNEYRRRTSRATNTVAYSFVDDAAECISGLLAEAKRLRDAWDDHHDTEQAAGLWCDRNDLLIRIEKLRAEVELLTPREVATVEELVALPVGTIVRDGFGVIRQKTVMPQAWRTLTVKYGGECDFGVPATVLYTPEDGENQ